MCRVLIADDHLEWREFSQQVLEKHGYDVILTETVEGLKSFLEKDRYDLILVNAELMRGEFREPIHRLFHQNADKPIIVISMPSSVHQTVQDTRTAFKLGAKDCVDKPFNAERLLALVQQLLEEFAGPQIERQGVQP